MGASDNVGSRTGVVGVLGHPIGHSLSPRMHNAALREQGLDMVYVAFDVPPERLEKALAGVRALGVRGVNLTIPHKEAAVPLLDEVEDLAARIGSVNTVVNQDGHLVGYNTDLTGFAVALRGLRAEGAQGLNCLVAGAGGAARAVVAALLEDRPQQIEVYNRTHERAVSLCARAGEWGDVPCLATPEHELFAAVARADLVVNATAVGLGLSVKESAIPVDILHSHQIVIDLVYGPEETPLVKEARARGATAIDGKEMLVMQAAGAYELWFGRRAPVDVMRRSISGER